MSILVTAATGATGREAIANLPQGGQHVRAMAHREDERSRALQALGAEVVYGDLNDYVAFKAALHYGRRPGTSDREDSGKSGPALRENCRRGGAAHFSASQGSPSGLRERPISWDEPTS